MDKLVLPTNPANQDRNPYQSQSKYIRRAIVLSWFTIFYNAIEGMTSIALGIEYDAISLAGFGIDSLIEVGSAFLVLWRFKGETGSSNHLSNQRERRATWGIGLLFVFLAIIIAIAAIVQLLSGSHPYTTLPGIIISGLSLSFMFFLWAAKKKVAKVLNSATVMKDADCSLACIKLSFILFIGSIVFFVFPTLWYTDAIASIILALLIGKEGLETLKISYKSDFSGGCRC